MTANENSKPVEPLAVPVKDVAKLLNVSERHVWTMDTTGRLPRPIRLGRAVRWNVQEMKAWFNAGAPPRDRWEQTRTPNPN